MRAKMRIYRTGKEMSKKLPEGPEWAQDGEQDRGAGKGGSLGSQTMYVG